MGIKKLTVSNFKSFGDLNIELGNFNVLIGANASGKSNFVQIFEFLRSISTEGLFNAVSKKGGAEFLTNMYYGSSKNLTISFVSDNTIHVQSMVANHMVPVFSEASYSFSMRLHKKTQDIEIIEEHLTQDLKSIKHKKSNRNDSIHAKIIISRDKNNGITITKPKFEISNPDMKNFLEVMFSRMYGLKEFNPNTLLLETLVTYLPPRWIFRFLSIYDFNTKTIKSVAPTTGKADLEEDGSNLAIVLKNILESDNDKRRKLLNLIQDILPFIKNIHVEKGLDKSLLLKLEESYFDNKYIPSFLLSDGTINLTALIIALYFESNELIIIEEPERYIHPHLISKVLEMIKEASKKKQIIITTHHPEVVKHAGLENLLLVTRDKQGFSQISRPSDKDSVKAFLKNDIGIDDLYIDNFLG